MTEPVAYAARPSLFSRELVWRLEEGFLVCPDGRRVALGDIARIQTYEVPGAQMAFGGGALSEPFERCVIKLRHGRKVTFASRHFLGFGRTESRWPTYNRFVDQLVDEVRELDRGTKFVAGMPRGLWVTWLLIVVAAAALALLATVYLLSLVIIRNTDLDQWMLGFFILIGALPGVTFYTLLRTGWPRQYDPRDISNPPPKLKE